MLDLHAKGSGPVWQMFVLEPRQTAMGRIAARRPFPIPSTLERPQSPANRLLGAISGRFAARVSWRRG